MRESTIEKKVCDYAETKGWVHYKFVTPGRCAAPDRILGRKGFAFFIEFKKTGEKPTKHQIWFHNKLRDKGFEVYVIDNVDEGKKLIDKFER